MYTGGRSPRTSLQTGREIRVRSSHPTRRTRQPESRRSLVSTRRCELPSHPSVWGSRPASHHARFARDRRTEGRRPVAHRRADVRASGTAGLIGRCCFAPERGEPRLLVAGLAGRAEVVVDQSKPAAADQPVPSLETVEAGVTAIDEALFVLATRVGHEAARRPTSTRRAARRGPRARRGSGRGTARRWRTRHRSSRPARSWPAGPAARLRSRRPPAPWPRTRGSRRARRPRGRDRGRLRDRARGRSRGRGCDTAGHP